MTTNMRERAERDNDGRLIWEKKIASAAGGTSTKEIDVSALLRPGLRKTGNIEQLLIEAEHAAEDEHGGNPSRPVNADVAKRAIEKIESKGLEPAWRIVDKSGFP